MPDPLEQQHCTPCRGGVQPMDQTAAEAFLADRPDWSLDDAATRIERRFRFKNFAQALAFVNEVGAIAEAEGHHPDIHFGWGYVTVLLQTHKIGGLHENDFIMAAKIDALPRP